MKMSQINDCDIVRTAKVNACPHCGGVSYLVKRASRFHEDCKDDVWCVVCSECESESDEYDRPDDALVAWNRRVCDANYAGSGSLVVPVDLWNEWARKIERISELEKRLAAYEEKGSVTLTPNEIYAAKNFAEDVKRVYGEIASAGSAPLFQFAAVVFTATVWMRNVYGQEVPHAERD